MQKSPSDTDRHIGARLRSRRVAIGLSQEKLGAALGITFQQVQKYEKGVNRMGAGRLQQAAHVLDVPVAYFYEAQPDGDAARPAGANVASGPLSADEAALLAAYRRLGDPRLRKRVQQLVQAIAEE
jgi:transcriptional regulator with XRE-family HTH domain